MSSNWAFNMAGLPLVEQRMEDIPRPRLELMVHVTTKTVQAGGLLGTMIVGPSIALISGHRDRESLKSWSQTCGSYGVLLGLVAGPWMMNKVLTSKNASEESVVDRCYRLRFNKGQLRVDRLSALGAAAGYGAATYLGDKGCLGALLGMSGGVLLAAVINNVF